jgi:hypothetical protein
VPERRMRDRRERRRKPPKDPEEAAMYHERELAGRTGRRHDDYPGKHGETERRHQTVPGQTRRVGDAPPPPARAEIEPNRFHFLHRKVGGGRKA